MSAMVKVNSAEIVGTQCDHSPVAVEFRAIHGKGPDGQWLALKLVASRFACWKCATLLPIDLKFLVLD